MTERVAVIPAYPLSWPLGWPRTPKRKAAAFSVSFATARDHLLNELRLLGARDVVMSSNIELRLDGLPYANRPEPADPAVAVFFALNGQEQAIPCDRWLRVRDNLRAIGLTIANLRGIDRYGTGGMRDAAFRGFAALPAGGDEGWWTVLGVRPDATDDQIEAAYKALARDHHPDAGGDAARFREVADAYRQARGR